jgi:DNA-binding response OmpR family regulator
MVSTVRRRAFRSLRFESSQGKFTGNLTVDGPTCLYAPDVASGRLLVVEDDAAIGERLASLLESNGFTTQWAATGAEALAVVQPPDLVVLDLGLPDIDGLDVCRQLRARWPNVFIVILTARTEEVDIVLGLDAGADDYVVKPFRLAELLARVRAHLRRQPTAGDEDRMSIGRFVIDVGARRVWIGVDEITLRTKEFDLLVLLATEAGRVVTRERIMREVWDQNWYGSTKTLDMHISNLRRKLVTDGSEGPIATVRGVGYRFTSP